LPCPTAPTPTRRSSDLALRTSETARRVGVQRRPASRTVRHNLILPLDRLADRVRGERPVHRLVRDRQVLRVHLFILLVLAVHHRERKSTRLNSCHGSIS